jgi:hypothetical protein
VDAEREPKASFDGDGERGERSRRASGEGGRARRASE